MPEMPDADAQGHLTERERRVYGRFLKKVGDGPAAFFLDACKIMHSPREYAAATHLVGHAIREIESALRTVLVPLAASSSRRENTRVKQIVHMLKSADVDEFSADAEWWLGVAEEKGGESQKDQIDAVLAELHIDETNSIASTWYELSGARHAHRLDLQVRGVDGDFHQYWSDTVDLFDKLLERLESRYLEYYRILDELLAIKTPSGPDVKRLQQRVPRNVVLYKYFFEQLDSPAWFPPLRKRGFFKNASSWYWPPATYLAKIASQFPEDVLNVMLGAISDSVLVHTEFAKAALTMPATVASRWAHAEADWVRRQQRIGWTLPEAYGKVIRHVVRVDAEAALGLLDALLADGRPDDAAELRGLFDESAAKIEWYEMERLMQQATPALCEVASQSLPRLVTLLATLLKSHREPNGWDSSKYWRSRISQDKGTAPGRRNELVTVIRNVALEALGSRSMGMGEVLAILDAENGEIFRRIARHLLAEFPFGEGPRIASELYDPDLLARDDSEYRFLAAKGFGELSAQQRNAFIEALEAGPDTDDFRSRVNAIRGIPPGSDDVALFKLRWQVITGDVIVAATDEEFQLRHAQRQEALSSHDENSRDEPTKTAAEIGEMSIEEVAAYAERVSSFSSTFGARSEEFAIRFHSAVAANPTFFSSAGRTIETFPPSLIARYLQGLREGYRTSSELHWDAVFELLEVVLAKRNEGTSLSDHENTWMWARQQSAWLLSASMEKDPVDVPLTQADRMWRVLDQLLSQEDDEAQPLEGSSETSPDQAYIRAMNSTLGSAIDTAAQYVLWLLDSGAADALSYKKLFFARLGALLEQPTPTIHAALGRAIGWLDDIDAAWLDHNLDRLLPEGSLNDCARQAAFSGIVGRWKPSPRLFQMLRGSYGHAIESLRDAAFGRSHTADRVAMHLVTFYSRGDLELTDSMLQRFFELAPGKLRGRFQWAIVNHLDAWHGAVPCEILNRLDALWEERVRSGLGSDDRAEEMSWYGFYYESHTGDPSRATETLKRLLESAVLIEDHRVVEKLARIGKQMPVLAFECYELMLRNEHRDRFLIFEEHGRDILQAALSTPQVSDSARDLIHTLASDGVLVFRDLLNEGDSND
jgi:hypothetical protein